jgi:hypothetical protein
MIRVGIMGLLISLIIQERKEDGKESSYQLSWSLNTLLWSKPGIKTAIPNDTA